MLTKLQRYARAKRDPNMALLYEMDRIERELEAKLTERITDNLRGKDGYSPKKGEDYFTPSEISQIVKYIESQIRVPLDGMKGEPGKDGRPGRDGKDAKELIPGVDYPTEKQLKSLIYTEIGALFAMKKTGENISRSEIERMIGKVQEKVDFKKHAEEIARALETLKNKERLDYNALKNTPDIPTDNKIESKVRGIMRGGGDRVRVYELTGDGTKTFTVPRHKRALLLIGSDMPYTYKYNQDFTTSGVTLTISTNTDAPSNGANLSFLYVE